MSLLVTSAMQVSCQILDHVLHRIEVTPAEHEPFSHVYFEELLPADLYARLLGHLPHPEHYIRASERYGDGEGQYVRMQFGLTPPNLAKLAPSERELWRGLAIALTSPELKRALFAKLARDLAFRYAIPESRVPELAGHARPTLYRETEGFEIPPHPDTRKKVVTMHLYWPADSSQVDLGTALYRRKLLGWPMGTWHHRFTKVKQFKFLPNSGYAFVVNNAITKKSWHGREKLPAGAGVRNTLLNVFYEEARQGFDDYLS